MILNPHRFVVAGGGIATPTHWWDLDDLVVAGGLADQGNGSNDMQLAAVGSVSVDTGDSPDGGNSLLINASSEYLHTATDHNWDGAGNAMTVSAWVKVDTLSATLASVMMWRDAGSGEDRIFHFNVQPGTPDHARWIVFDDAATEALILEDGTTEVAEGTWAHIAATFDGVDTIEIFVNGATEGTATNASFTNIENTATVPFAIGAASWDKTGAGTHLLGSIWACGIWDEVLTADQINNDLYNSGVGNKYADLW